MTDFQRYQGTDNYIAGQDLRQSVNVSIALGRPLLIKGEPGTSKTLLSRSVSEALNIPLVEWPIKSTTKAQDGLYIYDAVQRLHDSRFGDKDVSDIEQYIRMGPMGQAFAAKEQQALLIDEIDKADIEFPNDLLAELDVMRFSIYETGREVAALHRPVVIITSNAEKELPDAFLRRCVFHYIAFPDKELMEQIVRVHFPNVENKLLTQAMAAFYRLREIDSLRKKPSTSELLDWLAALQSSGIDPDLLVSELPFAGALIKTEIDMDRIQSLRGSLR